MSNKKKLYSSSSEEEDDDEDYMPRSNYHQSAVLNFKSHSTPIIQDKNQQLDVSREQKQEDFNCLKPKLKVEKQTIISNTSGVHIKNVVSEPKISQKQIVAAYTFKYKSPVAVKKKKTDPVSLFQKTSTFWKKDKFLTSRGNNKEGRKLDLDKRNKDTKVTA